MDANECFERAILLKDNCLTQFDIDAQLAIQRTIIKTYKTTFKLGFMLDFISVNGKLEKPDFLIDNGEFFLKQFLPGISTFFNNLTIQEKVSEYYKMSFKKTSLT